MSVRRCRVTGKHYHKSQGAAEAHLRSLPESYTGISYPCIYCRGWHVGRVSQKGHVNKYKGK